MTTTPNRFKIDYDRQLVKKARKLSDVFYHQTALGYEIYDASPAPKLIGITTDRRVARACKSMDLSCDDVRRFWVRHPERYQGLAIAYGLDSGGTCTGVLCSKCRGDQTMSTVDNRFEVSAQIHRTIDRIEGFSTFKWALSFASGLVEDYDKVWIYDVMAHRGRPELWEVLNSNVSNRIVEWRRPVAPHTTET